MLKNIFKIGILIFSLLGILSSCSVKKYVPENEYLINKYHLEIEKKYAQIEPSELKIFLKPKPNKKILGWRAKLYFHYRNQHKPTKFNTWLSKNFSETPAFYSDDDANRSAVRIEQYLDNIGFFNSTVSYRVEKDNKTAEITYDVFPAPPYFITKIAYDIADTTLERFFYEVEHKSLIDEGDIYNAFTMDDERDRITKHLRNNGYYYFNRNYIQFQVDSNYQNRTMAVTMKINNVKIPGKSPSDDLNKPHDRYFIKDVTVIPEFNPTSELALDTLIHPVKFVGDKSAYIYTYLLDQKPKLKPAAFDAAIKIKPRTPFSADEVQSTYRHLFNYSILRTVKINFDTTGAGTSEDASIKYMNSQIIMQNAKRNSVSVEGFGTNSSGDLGVRGKLTYLNKNIFKRADILRIQVIGGFEAQSVGGQEGTTAGVFNTFEAGVDGTLFFPRFLFPLKLRGFSEKHSTITNLTFGFNYQVRQNYTRNITNLEFGYSWNQTQLMKHIVTPINTNLIKVFPTPEFQEILDQEENTALKEQYSDQIVFGLSYSFIFNNQNLATLEQHQFFRLNLESSGNLLYGINTLANSNKTEEGYYQLFGIRYSQYLRGSIDYRRYFYFNNKRNSLATRVFIGSVIPYLNSEEVPYTKGFYGGGANGMRGWHFKELGPGSYSGTDIYERIGEIQIEANAELRFPVYRFFKLGLFLDIGNIWTYNESTVYPGGEFKLDTFYKQLAVDGGIGVRFDFSFFLIRVDFAAPFRDPAYPQNERWRIQYLKFSDFIANFGIGYPF
ncbi:MAG: BamA/TamA family outer membrane protein [Bacteroidetes bacterium]|nr:BamA/TamA family outer membrane protein [Bacteroidota bacterium]